MTQSDSNWIDHEFKEKVTDIVKTYLINILCANIKH